MIEGKGSSFGLMEKLDKSSAGVKTITETDSAVGNL